MNTNTSTIEKLTKIAEQAKNKICSAFCAKQFPLGNIYATTNLKDEETIWGITDNAVLADGATLADVLRATDVIKRCIAQGVNTRGLCLFPYHLGYGQKLLNDTEVIVKPVINFPTGQNILNTCLAEIDNSNTEGCKELDMVAPIGLLLDGYYHDYFDFLTKCIERASDTKVFVITKTATIREKFKDDPTKAHRIIAIASLLARLAGAYCIKSNTGWERDSNGKKLGTIEEDIMLMRIAGGDDIKIKAAGGISTFDDARRMIASGADFIGASNYTKNATLPKSFTSYGNADFTQEEIDDWS